MKNGLHIHKYYILCVLYFSWVFFFHICGSQYFTLFDVKTLSKQVNSVIIICLFIYVIFNYKIDKESIIDITLIVIFAIGYFYFKKGILVLLFILLCRNVPFSVIVKTFILASILGMFFVLCTYVLDMYPATLLNFFREDGTYRYGLGYRFPTFLPNFYFHLVLGWVFLRQSKITLYEIFIMLLVNYYLYISTDTKAVYYLVILTCIATIGIKYMGVNYRTPYIGRVYSFFTKYSFLLFGLVAIYLQYMYDPSIGWMGKIDSLFSGRLSLGHHGFQLYDISLFGNFVEFVPLLDASAVKRFFYIDSAYVQLLLVYGVAIYLLVLYAYTQIGKEIVKGEYTYYGLVLIILFAHSMTDPQLMSPEFNPFLLCLGYYGLDKYKENVFK